MTDQRDILRSIPHRPPFLWIDRIEELEAGWRCVATKYIDPDEPIFQGHFPGNAIFPGVLIIESAAQTAAVMLGGSRPNPQEANATCLLASVNRFKFLKPVRPGAVLRIETRKIAELGDMAFLQATVWVENEEVAKGELMVCSPGSSCQPNQE
jgi:3-hydroxyacyl-[acyl-carrier-protein] dehydratase